MEGKQDVDGFMAFLAISYLLAWRQGGAGQGGAAGQGRVIESEVRGEIFYDDVIARIGWRPRSREERRMMQRRLHQIVQLGEQPQAMGRRGGWDHCPLWRICDEVPVEGVQVEGVQVEEMPVKVVLAMPLRWARMLMAAQTAPYLMMGELLGAIPGNKASGAWARGIGLALAFFWRMVEREADDHFKQPTRRILLGIYPPKTGRVGELLVSKNPRFAVDYWCSALAILVENQFLEAYGEALISAEEMRRRLPRQGWGLGWLDEKVELRPGERMWDVIEGQSRVIPVAAVRRKRGRPRKDSLP